MIRVYSRQVANNPRSKNQASEEISWPAKISGEQQIAVPRAYSAVKIEQGQIHMIRAG